MLWIGQGIGEQELVNAVTKAASCMIPELQIVIRDKVDNYPSMRCCKSFYLPWRDGLSCCGEGCIGDGEILKRAGLDPGRFGSVHFAFGLERCAMVKYDLDDMRKLWQPPYVKK
jgi:phenylalanyl-tRNA synthetase alpha subunit